MASWLKNVLESYHAHIAAAAVGIMSMIAAAGLLKNWVFLYASIPYGLVFLKVSFIRDLRIMKTRHGWVCSSLLSLTVSAASVCIGYTHNASVHGLYAYLLVAIAALILLLTIQPVFDYGLLLLFLRLPVQIAVANFKTQLNCSYAAAVGLLVVGTILQCFTNSEVKEYEVASTAEDVPVVKPPTS